MAKEHRITQAETEVLNYIIQNQPVTVRQVADAMAERKGVARTTILTQMEQLRKKRFLARYEVNGIYHYKAARPASEVFHGLIQDFIQRSLGGSLSPFVAYMAEEAHLTDEEAAELERIANKIEKEADQ